MYPLLLPHQATDLLQTGERFRSRLTSGNQCHKRLIGIFVNPFAYTKSRAQKEWEGRGGHSKHTHAYGLLCFARAPLFERLKQATYNTEVFVQRL